MSVTLRIEGPEWTLYEEKVTPSGHAVTPTSGGTARPCTGGEGGISFTSTLDDVVSEWDGKWFDSRNDFLITSIEGIRATETSYWQLYINGVEADAGGCQSKIKAGDSLLAAWSNVPLSRWSLLYISASWKTVRPGQPVYVNVWAQGLGYNRVPVVGATVGGKKTDFNGQVELRFGFPAVKKLKATRAGFIRSATVTITVSNSTSSAEVEE